MLDEDPSHEGPYPFVKDDQGKRIKRDYQPPESREATGAPGPNFFQLVTGWWMYEVDSEGNPRDKKLWLGEGRLEMRDLGGMGGMGGWLVDAMVCEV